MLLVCQFLLASVVFQETKSVAVDPCPTVLRKVTESIHSDPSEKSRKVMTIDKILDEESNVVFQTKSIFKQWGDASEIVKFRRIKLERGKIIVFSFNKNSKKGTVYFYDSCGVLIEDRHLSKDELLKMFVDKEY